MREENAKQKEKKDKDGFNIEFCFDGRWIRGLMDDFILTSDLEIALRHLEENEKEVL